MNGINKLRILISGIAVVGFGIGLRAQTPSELRSIICKPGYSRTYYRLEGPAYRRFRDAAFAQAGEPTSKQCHRNDQRPDCLIVDHIVPLSVWSPEDGDPNAMSNVQLQTNAASKEKDEREGLARSMYCYEGAPLRAVQSQFHRASGGSDRR